MYSNKDLAQPKIIFKREVFVCVFVFVFLMWLICKVLIEFVTISLLFYVFVFWLQGMWDLNSLTRDQPRTSALKGKVLTTGPPGKSLDIFSFFFFFKMWDSKLCLDVLS